MKKMQYGISHGGLFHLDDVAFYVMSLWQELVLPGRWFRRDPTPEELADPTILVGDVGGEEDPEKSNHDHHQKGAPVRVVRPHVPYAATGLLLKQLIAEHENWSPEMMYLETLDRIWAAPIDASDNGWRNLVEGDGDDYVPVITLAKCVFNMNPPPGACNEDRDKAFFEAAEVVLAVFAGFRKSAHQMAADAKVILAGRGCFDGRALVLDKPVPTMKEQIELFPQGLLYVMFPSDRGGYCIQQIPTTRGGFVGRKPLPADWRGLRGEELEMAIGVNLERADAPSVFCHETGFIGGAETMDDLFAMAELAIDW